MNVADLIRQTVGAKPGRRRHHRQSLRLPMEYSFPESSRHRLACTVDISEGGLLMDAPEKLEIGQNLRLKLYHDSDSGIDSIRAHGEVIRAHRLGKSGNEYRCAVEFVDLSSDILRQLRKFLKTLS